MAYKLSTDYFVCHTFSFLKDSELKLLYIWYEGFPWTWLVASFPVTYHSYLCVTKILNIVGCPPFILDFAVGYGNENSYFHELM